MALARDEVSIKSGMCLWQISTLDCIGRVFSPRAVLPTCFSLRVFTLPVKSVFVFLERLVLFQVTVCVGGFTGFTSLGLCVGM